ncbi:hypothetical protein NDU88_002884 [Pleurodeles waltl]|uniref:Uncharacterized protein n=1 Tax=Pleurodeles waltl TaxID=8319 RepID=A0AAV7PFB5_PLEWA|nr:hypothetical protein NDU88_002884 [Pleurodeles waltl]
MQMGHNAALGDRPEGVAFHTLQTWLQQASVPQSSMYGQDSTLLGGKMSARTVKNEWESGSADVLLLDYDEAVMNGTKGNWEDKLQISGGGRRGDQHRGEHKESDKVRAVVNMRVREGWQ